MSIILLGSDQSHLKYSSGDFHLIWNSSGTGARAPTPHPHPFFFIHHFNLMDITSCCGPKLNKSSQQNVACVMTILGALLFRQKSVVITSPLAAEWHKSVVITSPLAAEWHKSVVITSPLAAEWHKSVVITSPLAAEWHFHLNGGFSSQIQVSRIWLSDYIPQHAVGCNYLAMSKIPASGTKVLNCEWKVSSKMGLLSSS